VDPFAIGTIPVGDILTDADFFFDISEEDLQ